MPDNPENRGVLRSLWDVHERVELDAALYYTGRLPEWRADRFFSLDVRLNWRVYEGVELGFVGRQLVGDHELVLDPEVLDTLASFNQRSVYTTLVWRPGGGALLNLPMMCHFARLVDVAIWRSAHFASLLCDRLRRCRARSWG